MKPQPLGRTSGLLALFVSILWGGNLVAIKLGLGTLPPMWSAYWRFVAGAVTVSIWAKIQGVSLMPRREDWTSVFALGLMFTAQITCLNLGVDRTSPGYGVVLLNSHPIFTNLFGHFFESEEKLSRRRIFGMALALFGMSYVAVGRPAAALAREPHVGNALLLVSATLLAVRVIYTRRLVQSMHPLRPVMWQMFFSLPLFLAAAWWFEPMELQPLTRGPVLAILYQGAVIGGFCFVMWTTLLQKHAASTLSMFGFLVPFFGVFLSALVFGEELRPHLIAGAGLVTLGIVIVTRKQKRPKPIPALPATAGLARSED